MATLIFDRRLFKRLFLLSLILNTVWVLISTQLEQLRELDKGFITGLGFIIIYSVTYFLSFPKAKRNFKNLMVLSLLLILIFLVSSFIIGPLFVNMPSKTSDFLACGFSSLFSAIFIVLTVKRYLPIHFVIPIITAVFLAAVGVCTLFITSNHTEGEELYTLSGFYGIWQVLTTTIIALSVSLKKDSAQHAYL